MGCSIFSTVSASQPSKVQYHTFTVNYISEIVHAVFVVPCRISPMSPPLHVFDLECTASSLERQGEMLHSSTINVNPIKEIRYKSIGKLQLSDSNGQTGGIYPCMPCLKRLLFATAVSHIPPNIQHRSYAVVHIQ